MPTTTTKNVAIKEGDLIKTAARPAVYVIEGGQRHLLPDAQTWRTNYPGKRAKLVTARALRKVPLGDPIPSVIWVRERQKIGEYLDTLARVPSPPSSSAVVSTALSTRNVDGVPHHFQDQVVRLVAQMSEYAFLSPVADVTWPGALVQGASLLGGQFAPINLDRAPGTLTVATDFAGAGTTKRSVVVEKPSLASVQDARTKLLQRINPKASAGSIAYFQTVARTVAHGMLKVGLTVDVGKLNVDANVKIDDSLETNTVLARFTQGYYTVGFEPSGSPARVFADGVKLADLKRYSGPANPPCYLSSVIYGRTLLVLVTARASTSEIAMAIKAKYDSGFSGSIEGKWDQLLRTSTVRVLSTGGTTAGKFGEVLSDPVTGLEKAIRDGLTFNLEHPGSPIAFTARYLRDSTIASVSMSTDYQETSRVWADDASVDLPVCEGGNGVRHVGTGIVVGAGDTVKIKAGDSIWSGLIFFGENGPDGWADKAPPSFPLPGEPPFALIAGYTKPIPIDATETGTDWYVAGSEHSEFHQGPARELLLSINDDNMYTGNKCFKVHVDVTRGTRSYAGVGSTA